MNALERFLEKYRDVYGEMYDTGEIGTDEEYQGGMMMFDEMPDTMAVLSQMRGDCFTSDREIAALYRTLKIIAQENRAAA